MKGIRKVPTIAVLASMLISVNRRSPTRIFSLGATTLAEVMLPEGGADEGRGCKQVIGR